MVMRNNFTFQFQSQSIITVSCDNFET